MMQYNRQQSANTIQIPSQPLMSLFDELSPTVFDELKLLKPSLFEPNHLETGPIGQVRQ